MTIIKWGHDNVAVRMPDIKVRKLFVEWGRSCDSLNFPINQVSNWLNQLIGSWQQDAAGNGTVFLMI